MTTIAEEKTRHLTYLRRIKPRALEVQNVLSYSIEQFPEEKTRLEYMSFVEENNLQHSWAAMLAWWRFRQHTADMDKSVRTAIKRTMELKKRQDYTLFSTCRRKHKSRLSPPLAVDPSPTKIPSIKDEDDDSEGTPPPPPPSPPKKKDTADDTIIVQKLIMRMSPRDWYEFMLMHNQHTQSLLPDLRKFLHTKYIHEENTYKRDKYGQLCNIVEYPLTFRPYEEDFAAKRKLTFDPVQSIDQANCNKPNSFINREFAGSTFPVYMSKEEYNDRCLSSHHAVLPNIHNNGGIEIDTIPQDPPYGLYRINEIGQMVEVK